MERRDRLPLLDATLRFNELKRRLPTATQRMLTRQLRELEECGLVHREIFPQVPPRVDYSLTEEGRSLAPIILAMHDWGTGRLKRQQKTSGIGARPGATELRPRVRRLCAIIANHVLQDVASTRPNWATLSLSFAAMCERCKIDQDPLRPQGLMPHGDLGGSLYCACSLRRRRPHVNTRDGSRTHYCSSG